MDTHFDVIVVGGGSAGGTAAFHLSTSGKRVLLIEKEKLPRYKTCGGGLSIEFLKNQFPFSLDEVIETDATTISYAYKGRLITMPINPGSVGFVMRSQLDAAILAHTDAKVVEGCTVKSIEETGDAVRVLTRDGICYTCDYLIGADGANSIAAKALGLRPRKTIVAAIEAEVIPSTEILNKFSSGPLFIFGELSYGYLWVFPKANHLSVGIATLHPKRRSLLPTLKKVMGRYGISLEDAEFHGHPIPIYSNRDDSEIIASKRILLAGDAAGLVDPFSGEGIRFAIKSGKIASQAILNNNISGYSEIIREEIESNHKRAKLAAFIFYRFQFLCIMLAAPNPFATQLIVDMLADRAPTIDLLIYSFLTLPIFWMLELAAFLIGVAAGKQSKERFKARVYGRV